MRASWILIVMLGCLGSSAWGLHAATLQTFTMERGYLTWSWEASGPDPLVTEYALQCAEVAEPDIHAIGPREYSARRIYPISQLYVRMAELMSPGTWCCQMATLDPTGTIRQSDPDEFCFVLAGSVILQGTEKE